jgi:hypothetical protein
MHTLDVLDTKLLDEAGREHTRGESTTEDVAKLRVEATDAHVLELEVRGQNGVWCSPVARRRRKGFKPSRKGSYFLVLVFLSLIKLSPALTNVMSVFSMRIPMFCGAPPPPPLRCASASSSVLADKMVALRETP